MPAFLNAVACWLPPLPAAWMPALIAVTSEFTSVTPARFTETATRFAPEVEAKPGPLK